MSRIRMSEAWRGNLRKTAAVHGRSALGFTLTEMLISMAIFLAICGSAFTLLGVSQQRYQAESQTLNSFQDARLAMDQIVRDVSDAGFPPPNQFETPPANNGAVNVAVTPFAWSPGYLTNNPCAIGACSTPGPYGLFIETNPTPLPTPQVPAITVEYIRYKLLDSNPTILGRGVFQKSGADPYSTIPDTMLTPFVLNVMNQASPAQIAQINAAYPNMFPGGNQVPLFTYLCDSSTGPQNCANLGLLNGGTPANIRSVLVTLIVETPTPDPQTGQIRVIELTGEASRINSFP